ncbi:hypothetical protein PV646_35920 [Streptomyces sp. ID05-26A]|nr:hypothetical protein [Streptomyces sp. ID05-26A]
MRSQVSPAEVLVSEQTAMSIKVSVGPQASGGLAELAAEHLADTLAEARREERRKSRPTISNKLDGRVNGIVFQVGTIHNMKSPDGR